MFAAEVRSAFRICLQLLLEYGLLRRIVISEKKMFVSTFVKPAAISLNLSVGGFVLVGIGR